MLLFGVTIPATVPQGSEIPEGLMNNPVYHRLVMHRNSNIKFTNKYVRNTTEKV